ncbi:hypothetical protein ACWIG4_19295 [Streptomyces sp. NPDC002248]
MLRPPTAPVTVPWPRAPLPRTAGNASVCRRITVSPTGTNWPLVARLSSHRVVLAPSVRMTAGLEREK